MRIRLKVDKVNMAFKTKNLVYVAGMNLETSKYIKGFTHVKKEKFIEVLKLSQQTGSSVVVVVATNAKGFTFINPGNQELNEA